MKQDASFYSTLAVRERYRDDYWRKHDPIAADRLLWRAQAFRHIVHLLPGQTILELGCGEGLFTHALLRVSRGENPITVVTFQKGAQVSSGVGEEVELLATSDLLSSLAGRHFDYVVAMDLLDRSCASQLLAIVHALLVPGGQMVFYESNPWNPVHKLRQVFSSAVGKRDPRHLLSRRQLYKLLLETDFVGVDAVYNDFVFAPLTRRLIRFNSSAGAETAAAQGCAEATAIHPRIAARSDLLRDSVS